MENNEIILNSIRYMEEKLEEELSVSNIASHMGYSEFHFSRLFTKQMGISVMEYVKKRRLLHASEKILAGEKIIDVAFSYGYASHGGFSKAFKQEFGFSPILLRAMRMELDCYKEGNYMSHVFMKQTKIHATKEELFQMLVEECKKKDDAIFEQELEETYQFACKAYEGRKRYSGDEYITHPLNVALLLAEMGAERPAVLAGMLCDVMAKTGITEEELGKNVAADVKEILMGVAQFKGTLLNGDANESVSMVKLAERLHNMRTIEFMPTEEKAEKAKETVVTFMPIANRLGNEKLIAELNDLALKYME